MALSGADPDPAAPASTPPAAAKAVEASDMEKIVCKMEDVTGSRLGSKRVCMTKLQWEQRSQDDRNLLKTNQQGSANH